MLESPITICNRLGLHARAAAKLVDTANRFGSSIVMQCNGKSADCKSIMQIIMLAAAQGTNAMLTAEGEDAHQAMEAIVLLINDRFGEEE
jgi:phosphocarrier protein HPr